MKTAVPVTRGNSAGQKFKYIVFDLETQRGICIEIVIICNEKQCLKIAVS